MVRSEGESAMWRYLYDEVHPSIRRREPPKRPHAQASNNMDRNTHIARSTLTPHHTTHTQRLRTAPP
jgi:hypothetical protein